MKLTITIDCNNAAFEDENLGPEIAHILTELAERYDGPLGVFEIGTAPWNLHDANGNHCGEAVISD